MQEKPHFGMPAFRVADKGFVAVAKDHSRVLLDADLAALDVSSSPFGPLPMTVLLPGFFPTGCPILLSS